MSLDDQTKQLQPSVLAVVRHEFIQAFNEESSLAGMANSTYETLWPHGLRHLWTGPVPTYSLSCFGMIAEHKLASSQANRLQLLHSGPSTWHELNKSNHELNSNWPGSAPTY